MFPARPCSTIPAATCASPAASPPTAAIPATTMAATPSGRLPSTARPRTAPHRCSGAHSTNRNKPILMETHLDLTDGVLSRARELMHEHQDQIYVQTSHLFAILMSVQWLAGIAAALIVS